MDEENLSWREKYRALKKVAAYRPVFTAFLIFFSAGVALLEGIGLGFIHPILEVAQGETAEGGRVMELFLSGYEFLGIPFSLGYLIIGVSLVMVFRFTMTFLNAWLKHMLAKQYERDLRKKTFDAALNGKIRYFDREGSDNILNAIITETRYSGKVISLTVKTMEKLFLVLMYLAVMLYISPVLTTVAVALLGGITVLLRFIIEPAVTVGSRVAEANEKVQQSVQSGTQGIKDVKLFGMKDRIYSSFETSVNKYSKSEVELSRNEAAINNFYRMSAAVTLFGLIYIGFTFTELRLGALGIFLLAMFQLAPRVSGLNSHIYKLEGYISHLVRTEQFLDELSEEEESHGGKDVEGVSEIQFEGVEFSYNEEEKVLNGVSFEAGKDDFVAFVGKSGAGKSTIVSLIARMYDANAGTVKADGTDIEEYDLEQWRERISVVRQDPFIFNTTLAENVKIADPETSDSELEKVCEIARVDEFLDDLPNGMESQLGDEGVRLSGGQKQRVALARALLKDADFLVLDEATSDLDSNLEKEVQKNIEEMESEYGIIAIAHRLSTVQNADRIHTLQQGEIIETGTHEELLEKGGKYAELYEIQSKE